MPIINFSHQKGGVGKSLLSYHLAYLLKDNYDVQLLDLDNQKSLSSIHKLRNHKLQQHSIPIKTVHSKHELIDLINSIDDNQYLIIDSGGFDSLYTRLAILGADINISPTADKTIELLALVTAYDSTLHQLSRKLRKNISCYVLLNRIHHSAKDFSHIDSLLSKSKPSQNAHSPSTTP